MKQILSKLRQIQSELKANKSQYNSFGKYHYRSLEDIMEALKPLLQKYQCTFVISNDVTNIEGLFFRKSVGTLYCCESGESISTSTMTQEATEAKGMSPSQVSGSSSSFSDKYLCGKMFCIDDTKDSDATNTHGVKSETPKLTELDRNNKELLDKTVGYFKKNGHLNGVEKKYFISEETRKLIEEKAKE